MRTEIIYENRSLYRGDFIIQGYIFGSGKKSVCVVGNTRGNEFQQLYTCSRLVQELKKAESQNLITPGYEIMVIPSCNPYSMNIKKRFWPIDNTDINRMFPGYVEGETTQRIAGGIFEKIKDYEYGIQLASNYMPGEFMPHINIMKTDMDFTDLAVKFGMPYVVVRKPRPYDATTLNYNWQIWDTKAFSLYTTTTDRINPSSARRGVKSIFSFLGALGIMRYHGHEGYRSQIVNYDDMISVRSPEAGFFEPVVKVEEEVKEGDVLACIRNPVDGEILAEIKAPADGVIFFIENEPLTYAHTAVIKLISAI